MAVDEKAREQLILDAAADLIIRYGYNKTTMSDVADTVGLSRGLVYVHFKSKDEVLEALIKREMMKYGETWIQHIEADPKGGTVASMYRSIVYALKHTPFMAAIVTRDEHTFGKYLRKPGNFLQGMQSVSATRDLLEAMQQAGVVRQGVNIAAMAYIMDTVSFGLVGMNDVSNIGVTPTFEAVMETTAEMLDRMLTPDDGGNLEAGKEIIRQIATRARAYFQQMEQAGDQKEEDIS